MLRPAKICIPSYPAYLSSPWALTPFRFPRQAPSLPQRWAILSSTFSSLHRLFAHLLFLKCHFLPGLCLKFLGAVFIVDVPPTHPSSLRTLTVHGVRLCLSLLRSPWLDQGGRVLYSALEFSSVSDRDQTQRRSSDILRKQWMIMMLPIYNPTSPISLLLSAPRVAHNNSSFLIAGNV